MELGSQIRMYRTKAGLSQEQLAEKIFVTRQTISNWENDRSYPDIRSLVLLGEVFQISLDQLIKGDLENMKREIDRQEYDRFHTAGSAVQLDRHGYLFRRVWYWHVLCFAN